MTNSKIASELTKIAKMLVAIDFPNQQAMDKYLKDHPKANKLNHKVVQNKKPITEQTQTKPAEKSTVSPSKENHDTIKSSYLADIVYRLPTADDESIVEKANFNQESKHVISELAKYGIDRRTARTIAYAVPHEINTFMSQNVKPVEAAHMAVTLNHYAANGYKEVNDHLYGKNTSKRAAEAVEWLDKAITKAPPHLIDNSEEV